MNNSIDSVVHLEHTHVWHNLPVQEGLRELAAAHAGLSLDEAARRLKQYGSNRLPAAHKGGLLVRFARRFD